MDGWTDGNGKRSVSPFRPSVRPACDGQTLVEVKNVRLSVKTGRIPVFLDDFYGWTDVGGVTPLETLKGQETDVGRGGGYSQIPVIESFWELE